MDLKQQKIYEDLVTHIFNGKTKHQAGPYGGRFSIDKEAPNTWMMTTHMMTTHKTSK